MGPRGGRTVSLAIYRHTGTTLRRIASERLAAGVWSADVVLGVPDAASTATLYLRAAGSATNILTFTSGAFPARLAAQRFTLAVATEVEWWAVNSSITRGSVHVEDPRFAYVGALGEQLWANGVRVALGAILSAVATTLVVAEGQGALLPSPGAGQFFEATLQRGNVFEVVRCTARSGDTLTVVRAQEGTTARQWPVTGTTLALGVTAGALARLRGPQ